MIETRKDTSSTALQNKDQRQKTQTIGATINNESLFADNCYPHPDPHVFEINKIPHVRKRITWNANEYDQECHNHRLQTIQKHRDEETHNIVSHTPGKHLKAGHHLAPSKTPFKWRFADGPVVADNLCWLRTQLK